MKKLTVIFLSLLILVSCGKEPIYEFQYQNGVKVLYDIANDKLVTGTIETWDEMDGTKYISKKSEYKKGLLHGRVEHFNYKNQLELVEDYFNGVLNGETIEYNPDSKNMVNKAVYKESKIVTDTMYDKDGKLYMEHIFKNGYSYYNEYENGKKKGILLYDKNGFLKKVNNNPKEITIEDMVKVIDLSEYGYKFYMLEYEINKQKMDIEVLINHDTEDPDIAVILGLQLPFEFFMNDDWLMRNGYELSQIFTDIVMNGYITITGEFDEKGNLMSTMIQSTTKDVVDYIVQYGKNNPQFNGVSSMNMTEVKIIKEFSKFIKQAYNFTMSEKANWYSKNRT